MKAFTPEEEQEFFSWIPNEITQKIIEYINNTALKCSRYLVTRRLGNRRMGYCTHCRHDTVLTGTGWSTGSEVRCPACGNTVIVKYERSMHRITDRAIAVWYDKSLRDPRAIVARAFEVCRSYCDGYRNVDTGFTPWAAYIFVPAADRNSYGKSRMAKPTWEYEIYGHNWTRHAGHWVARNKVFSPEINGSNMYPPLPVYCCRASIRDAVAGTPFAWSGWEKVCCDTDCLRFFDLAARYPCVEYLVKLGMSRLIEEKLLGCGGKVINWRARTPWGIMRMTRDQMRTVKPVLPQFDSAALEVLQSGYRDGSNYTPAEAFHFTRIFDTRTIFSGEITMGGLTTIRRAAKYLVSQSDHPAPDQNDMRWTLRTWREYIGECRQLELNLEDDRVLYPKNLREAHASTSDLIKAKGNALLNKAIAKYAKELRKRLCWQDSGLLIRPAISCNELIREGRQLHICVGGMHKGSYIHQYAAQETILLLIRHADAQKTPFYCVEVSPKGEVRQVRGEKNCPPTPEVRAFMDQFAAQILTQLNPKHIEKSRIQVAI